ncbi:MAG: aminotransferase class V-fold PLP-dependent enzyme [Cardiobacteriaceae bacterium]|nr:aminotransferase class V-fold PLP-dependent enzyme [Cardiobacteriaceae bacterium]
MPALHPHIDPDGHLEYSVVYTDRALNHMSQRFQTVMRDLSALLKHVYHADAVAIVPGSGTYAMEAVARQFVQGQNTLIIRNGLFSYRWTQIIDTGKLSPHVIVMKAQAQGRAFAPAAIADVTAAIARERPAVVFAPHVETASGMILPDDYIRALADATHAAGGLLVIDCVASGAIWLDMQALGIDILLSAPQKGWSGTPCCGLVMLGERALARLAETESDSFACDLKKWHAIMQAYENGTHAYHATMPTDSLLALRDVMHEAQTIGFDTLKTAQQQLGAEVRTLLAQHGYHSVAADGYGAPGVVVCHTDNPELASGRAFAAHGMQIAAGVPLQIDEPADYQAFRIGLFGLDKLQNIPRTVNNLRDVLEKLQA